MYSRMDEASLSQLTLSLIETPVSDERGVPLWDNPVCSDTGLLAESALSGLLLINNNDLTESQENVSQASPPWDQ